MMVLGEHQTRTAIDTFYSINVRGSNFDYTESSYFHCTVTGDEEAINDGDCDEKDDEDDDEDEDELDDDDDEASIQQQERDRHGSGDGDAQYERRVEIASAAHARPRRLSELRTPDAVKPIPNSSSLFVFSPTNRCAQNARRSQLVS